MPGANRMSAGRARRDHGRRSTDANRSTRMANRPGSPPIAGSTLENALVGSVLAEQGGGKDHFSMSETTSRAARAPWVVIGQRRGGFDPGHCAGRTHPAPTLLRAHPREVQSAKNSLNLEDRRAQDDLGHASRLASRPGLVLRNVRRSRCVCRATSSNRATYGSLTSSPPLDVVLVNGVTVWKNGAATNEKPGRALRGPGTACP